MVYQLSLVWCFSLANPASRWVSNSMLNLSRVSFCLIFIIFKFSPAFKFIFFFLTSTLFILCFNAKLQCYCAMMPTPTSKCNGFSTAQQTSFFSIYIVKNVNQPNFLCVAALLVDVSDNTPCIVWSPRHMWNVNMSNQYNIILYYYNIGL